MRPSKVGVTMARHLPSEECPKVSQVLARIGEKWSVLIIIMLAEKTRRFSELKRAIGGVSQRMLTLSLRGLERDGLVKRTVFPVVPPRVEYELTALGRSLRSASGRAVISARSTLPARPSIARRRKRKMLQICTNAEAFRIERRCGPCQPDVMAGTLRTD